MTYFFDLIISEHLRMSIDDAPAVENVEAQNEEGEKEKRRGKGKRKEEERSPNPDDRPWLEMMVVDYWCSVYQ